jgi:L-ascorbate metabolism protein UlaG (beta-lactamase superfamily)
LKLDYSSFFKHGRELVTRVVARAGHVEGFKLVKVRWLGHSCWEIKGNNVTILTDPHDGECLGLSGPVSKPDIVLVSHYHEDHASGVKLFNQSMVLDSSCEKTVKDVKINGIKTYHDDVEGERLGENIFFKFVIDGLVFGHTGDLGHILGQNKLSRIGLIEILFSGISTIAQANMDLIGPRLVIPMHYHLDGIIFPWFKMPDVFEFVKEKENQMLNTDTFMYSKDNLPQKRRIHVYKL